MNKLKQFFAATFIAASSLIGVTPNASALSPAPGTDTNSPEWKEDQQAMQDSHIAVPTPPIPAPEPITISDPTCFVDSSCDVTVNADGSRTYTNPVVVAPSVTFDSFNNSAHGSNDNNAAPQGSLLQCRGQDASNWVCKLTMQ